MYPIIWSFGRVNIYSHGVLIALGALIGGYLLYALARRKNYPTHFILDLCLFSVFFGLIGARLLYFWLYPNLFEHWYEVFYVWQGGLVSYGGFLAAFGFAFFYLKSRRQSVWQWFDLAIGPFFVGWVFGRIGCFLSGDLLGAKTSSPLALNGQWPIALLEAGWSLSIAIVCIWLSLGQKLWSKGLVFSIGLALYGFGRFLIDFLRVDNTYSFLKYSQIGDILLIILAIIFILLILKRGNKAEERSQDGATGTI